MREASVIHSIPTLYEFINKGVLEPTEIITHRCLSPQREKATSPL